ncbi:MAG: hypothetical protein ACRDT0_05140 [Pseudonocardiaceae bacterium]
MTATVSVPNWRTHARGLADQLTADGDVHTAAHTAVDPAELDGGKMFLAQLHLPPDMFRSIRLTDDQTPVTYLAAPDGSWCEITRVTPDLAPRSRNRPALDATGADGMITSANRRNH